ncbi:MAG: hydrogenase maturation peptidase HycI [Methanobacterium sp.]|nr:hydrogenase maturation peptidase HycI [Methanobacterium sp.]
MIPLKPELKEFQEALYKFIENHEKIVFLGIGNQLRGDDYSGALTALKLSHKCPSDDVTIIDGGSVPENYTGLIRKEDPSHIILIDAADMGKPPGYLKLIKKEEISQYNISTHAMPLSFLIKYLEQTTRARIILIGIQPLEMELANALSEDVKKSVDFLVDILRTIC